MPVSNGAVELAHGLPIAGDGLQRFELQARGIDQMVSEGLVTLKRVQVLQYRGGQP